MIGGALAARSQSHDPILKLQGAAGWEGVRVYARFPAGLPPDLPRMLPTRRP